MGSNDDNLNVSTEERMRSLATTKASAQRLQSQGSSASELGQQQSVPLAEARAIIETWPEAPKGEAKKLLDHYGPPNEATPTKLFWYRTGPWARIELTADEILHSFPTTHTDFLTQYVDYPIKAERAAELVEFDGSVIVDRTAGQLGGRCDSEAANTVTLNLAVDIIEGRRTVDDARHFFAETLAAYAMGRDAPYAERLQFNPPSAKTGDQDEGIIGSAMLDQLGEKIKDAFGSGDLPQ
jgi:hypothetical protein